MTPTAPRKKTLESARRVPVREQKGRRILVVDDDAANIDVVKEGLGPLGYAFHEAHDGPGALSSIRQERPDLILMDVEMPGLSGVEVCRIVKANQGEGGFGFIPVILMTARKASSKIEGLELGADDYLVKPFDMLELGARVKSMMRLKILQDQLLDKNRELDRANRELDRLSRTDALTGLFNRRYFEERFAVEFARSNRYRAPLSCLMVDIDHFKRLNDSCGHAFGDRVLRAVSEVTLDTLRDVDMLARYGGEEFVALLPETGPVEALRAGERVRKGIEGLGLLFESHGAKPKRVPCTASIGVATFPVPGIETAEGLLRAADDALYAAKRDGRNRVCQHED